MHALRSPHVDVEFAPVYPGEGCRTLPSNAIAATTRATAAIQPLQVVRSRLPLGAERRGPGRGASESKATASLALPSASGIHVPSQRTQQARHRRQATRYDRRATSPSRGGTAHVITKEQNERLTQTGPDTPA